MVCHERPNAESDAVEAEVGPKSATTGSHNCSVRSHPVVRRKFPTGVGGVVPDALAAKRSVPKPELRHSLDGVAANTQGGSSFEVFGGGGAVADRYSSFHSPSIEVIVMAEPPMGRFPRAGEAS